MSETSMTREERQAHKRLVNALERANEARHAATLARIAYAHACDEVVDALHASGESAFAARWKRAAAKVRAQKDF